MPSLTSRTWSAAQTEQLRNEREHRSAAHWAQSIPRGRGDDVLSPGWGDFVYAAYRDVENAQYGFRRKLLGLKWIGILIAGAALGVALRPRIFAVVSAQGIPFAHAVADRPPVDAAAAANAIALVVWLAVVRPSFVRQAADEYSLSLFRILDA
jgi:hypothetical protein